MMYDTSLQIMVYETTNPYNDEPVTLKIVFKNTMKMDESIQFYNVLFNRIMRKLNLAKIGNNYYAPGGSVLVPQHRLVSSPCVFLSGWFGCLC